MVIRLSKLWDSRIVGLIITGILSVFFNPAVAQQDSDQDESLLAPVQLAARAGDFELALNRVEIIVRPDLKTKAFAVLGEEYARVGNQDLAEQYYSEAQEILNTGRMRKIEQASAHLFLARSYSRNEQFTEKAQEHLNVAADLIGGLAGISLDLGLFELAAVSYQINKDVKEVKQIISLIGDQQLRTKLLAQYE